MNEMKHITRHQQEQTQ